MDSTTPFRLATQIHLGLLRHLGTGIEVPAMMEDKSYAREVIYVCLGCADPDLNRLAQEFIAMKNAEREARSPRTGKRTVPATIPMLPPAVKPKAAPAAAPAEAETTSFELSSQFIQDDSSTSAAAAPPRKRWFDPARWLRRGAAEN